MTPARPPSQWLRKLSTAGGCSSPRRSSGRGLSPGFVEACPTNRGHGRQAAASRRLPRSLDLHGAVVGSSGTPFLKQRLFRSRQGCEAERRHVVAVLSDPERCQEAIELASAQPLTVNLARTERLRRSGSQRWVRRHRHAAEQEDEGERAPGPTHQSQTGQGRTGLGGR